MMLISSDMRTTMAEDGASGKVSGFSVSRPTIAVTAGGALCLARCAESQIDQFEASVDIFFGINVGAPGIPTSGPPGMFAIAEALTNFGNSGLPVISCADVKLCTGCIRWPMRTNSAPFCLIAMIFSFPNAGWGEKSESTKAPTVTKPERIIPTVMARDELRSGSCSIRVSHRTNPCMSRCSMKFHPDN